MKKIILLGATIMCGLGAFAQANVLKDAERAMKAKEPMKKVVEIVTPAFTNPETQSMSQTWYIPGKAAFNQYDELLGLEAFGKLPEDGKVTMGQNLLDGYDYMMKALSLDSVPDAKGKIKTKYSKDIVNTLVGHYNDYNNNAINLWNIQDYKGAYKSWDIYLSMSAQPEKYKGIQMPADTLLSEIAYNQALAAWQAQDPKASLECFIKSKNMGYNKKQVYDYAISVATELGDSATLLSLASEAMPIYGDEDPLYLNLIINDYLIKQDYPNALKYINDAIAHEPNNPEYYVVLGVIYDTQEKRAEAKEAYNKALAADPNSAKANYYYGREIYQDAYEASDKGPSDASQINAYFDSTVRPLLEESAKYLEKANQLDPENPDPLKLLENVYYSLNDEAKLNDVQNRLKLI
ncbi:MAG: tetratricopeptide repeat protein [Muribaculaceae bacterium]|nr:tetratricopeptide repeat protein [Muribaculaceae bacterium]